MEVAESMRHSERKSRIDRSGSSVPLIFWVGLLIYMSGSAGSTVQTIRRIRPILEFLFPSFPPSTINSIHRCIRKFSHFAGYGILAYLAVRAFTNRFDRKITWRTVSASVLLAGIVAVADEAKQSTEPSRVGSVNDVLLDVSGASFAAVLCLLFSDR